MIYTKKYIEYDFSFLKEITELIIANLTELNEALARGVNINDPAQCVRNLHKSKITLNLIGNDLLLSKAELISQILKAKSLSEEEQFLVESFQKGCSQEIINLYARLKYFENYLASGSKIN